MDLGAGSQFLGSLFRRKVSLNLGHELDPTGELEIPISESRDCSAYPAMNFLIDELLSNGGSKWRCRCAMSSSSEVELGDV